MKYVVELKRTVTKIVVVEAEDDEEADEKLKRDDIENEFAKIETDDVYNGFSYVDHKTYSGKEEQRLICSLADLSEYLGIAEHEIERYIYKNTDCGMAISYDKNGITLVGHVECGCECDIPFETLKYPFTVKEFEDTVRDLELEADSIWHDVNGYGEDGGIE